MSGNIKGITVEIGGDVKGLNKALEGVNKEIKNTQSQLKDVERLLKLDPTNTELLQQKQRLLAQAVEETSGKLDTLKNAEKQAEEQFKQGKISREQYDALKREVIATEYSLDSLEKQAAKSNAALNKIGETAKKVAAGADDIAKKTQGLSLAAGGLLTAMAGGAVKAGQYADEINTLSKVTGLSTEQIQKFQYASEVIDVDINTLTGSMAKLTKNMAAAKGGSGATADAFAALGVSVRDDLTGELRGNQDVFTDVIKALGEIENETERDALAMKIFGKSAQELNPLILGGADALKELGDEAEAAGLILSQDALDGANEFNDGLDKLKATATASFMSAGSTLSKTLLPALEKLIAVVSNVLLWIAGLDESQLKLIGTILLVVAAISPVFSTISKISGAIEFLTTTAIPGLSGALSFLAANPIVLVIAAVVALIAAIALFGDDIQAVLSGVNEFMQNIFIIDWTEQFGALGNILNGFFVIVKSIWDAIMRIFSGIIDFVRGVFTGDWERAWKGVVDIFGGAFELLIALAKAPINGIIAMLNAAIDGINLLIEGLNKIHFDIPDWVPVLGGKSFGINIPLIGKIPFLAKGGILSSGSAIVGEAGPELLSLVNGKAVVRPLTGQYAKAAPPQIVQNNTFNDYTHAQGEAAVRDLNRMLGRAY